MAEWSNAPVLKTGVLRGTGGSNPSLSAQSPVNRKIYRTLLFVLLSSPPSPSENGCLGCIIEGRTAIKELLVCKLCIILLSLYELMVEINIIHLALFQLARCKHTIE